jgi:protein arginine kinase activator
MQCEHCDNKATVFYTQIIDGISKKTKLCESCANQKGITDPEGFLLEDQEVNPHGHASAPKAAPKVDTPMSKQANRCCPGCGFAFDDLKKTGRLGCSECYDYFREEIKHNLGGMHKGTTHTGRVPEGLLKAYEERQELQKLQHMLDEAVNAEDYEKAAALRDEISKISEQETSAPEQPSQP